MNQFKWKKISEEDKVYSSEPLYDLIYGGYINPFQLLDDDEQATAVSNAAGTVQAFLDEAVNTGALGEI